MSSRLDELSFVAEEGALFVKGAQYLLIRPETLAALAQAVGPKAGEAFFAAGREGGRSAARAFLPAFEAETAVRRMLEAGGRLGWARMELIAFDLPGRRFEVKARGAALSWPGGEGWRLLAGVLASLGEAVFGGRARIDQSSDPASGGQEVIFGVRVKA